MKIRNYKEFKELNEQSATPAVMNIPQQFQGESNAINQLRDTIAATEQDLAAKKLQLNNLTKELQDKIAAETAQQAAIQAQQPAQPAQQNTPTV